MELKETIFKRAVDLFFWLAVIFLITRVLLPEIGGVIIDTVTWFKGLPAEEQAGWVIFDWLG